ncbi:MAG: S46 family peptidase [Acidobacteriota bacterium]|nr:MAG: S46 family peptidase [Acidobacteriota bacterium]
MYPGNRRRYAVRLVVVLILFSLVPVSAFVRDEGMYAPDQISRLPLKKRGLKIDPSELYDPSKPTISDAIVRVNIPTGGFGTGEFVSADGLVLTNHHVGFDALVEASTSDNDLGDKGYSATSRVNELPAKGYTIILTKRVENVTAKVLQGTESLSDEAREARIAANIAVLERAEKANRPGSQISVQELNEGFFYYLYETETIKDVRIAYAPPKSIGFFGGDPDNFEWTRHTGDFTFLRPYVAPDGTFAEYSPDNVPYKPKRHLKISLEGVDEGEFVMVMGYPGGTTRFRESATIEYAQNVNFPYIAEYVKTRSETWSRIAEEQPERAVELQAEIFNLNNAEKLYSGNVEAMKRANVVEQRREQERALAKWIDSDPGRKARYGDLFEKIDRLTTTFYRDSKRDRALSIFPSGATTKAFAAAYAAMASAGQRPAAGPEDKKKRETAVKAAFEGWDPVFETEMIRFFLRKIDELPDGQRFAHLDSLLGDKKGKERRAAESELASKIVDAFDTPGKVLAIYDMSLEQIEQKYPDISGLVFALQESKAHIADRAGLFEEEIAPLRLKYRQALAEWKNAEPYPDANSTLRFSFGNVKGYSPREAVTYHPFTTLAGVLEKDTGIEPFDVPDKLKELFKKGDFGVYGEQGSLPVNFLSDTDIIGGNSGSPVLNGRGEQVGLVFDGNYEGLGNDMFFNPARGRTISVDIRYVLFLTEKFGDSGWLLNEMEIRKPKGKK